MYFDSWDGIGRVLVAGVVAYAGLIAVLRVSGNRTLSKMNAFDFIVTVALGSTLATVIISKQVPLAEGLLALALLVSLQYAVTWLSVRVPAVSDLVKSEPVMLAYQGRFLPAQMKRARVVEEEVLAALRENGGGDLDAVQAVVLETDGTFSIVTQPGTALANVAGPAEGLSG